MAVVVSPKFQITIPKKIREAHNIQPGQKWEFIQFGDALRLVPVLDLQDVQELFEGKCLKNDFSRDAD